MQIAALQNHRNVEADTEILRVVNEMRKNKESIDAGTRARVFSIYAVACGGYAAAEAKLLLAVPPIEHLEMFQSLFYDQDFDPSKRPGREVCLAALYEAAGRPGDALRTLQAVRSGLSATASGGLVRAVEAGIARLSRRPTQPAGAR
jgi:hypothetical protein